MRLKSIYIIIYISFAEGEFDAAEPYSRIVSKIQEQKQAKQRAFNWHMGLRRAKKQGISSWTTC